MYIVMTDDTMIYITNTRLYYNYHYYFNNWICMFSMENYTETDNL